MSNNIHKFVCLCWTVGSEQIGNSQDGSTATDCRKSTVGQSTSRTGSTTPGGRTSTASVSRGSTAAELYSPGSTDLGGETPGGGRPGVRRARRARRQLETPESWPTSFRDRHAATNDDAEKSARSDDLFVARDERRDFDSVVMTANSQSMSATIINHVDRNASQSTRPASLTVGVYQMVTMKPSYPMQMWICKSGYHATSII